MQKESGWKQKSKEEVKEIFEFCEEYKAFLDRSKTEREAAEYIKDYLAKNGFSGEPSGDKVFRVNRGKEVIAFRKGETNPLQGLRIIVAHTDAPRLDLKQNPVYEDVDIALLRTHYYGGIKKYQWVAIPLALHGIVVRGDGTTVTVTIGESDDDPVFLIDDLLPHLSRKHQDEKKLADAIEGEKLTVLFGNMPLVGAGNEPVKKSVLAILQERYGIAEEDFISAELEIVPAFKARDVGIDRSMVGAYGQDDRVSVFTLLKAVCDAETPKQSCIAIFTDKEEIGSEGNTGMRSGFLQTFLYDILEGMKIKPEEGMIRKILFQSKALSADVNSAVNPTFQEVHEKQNACYLGRGIGISKFTGHLGKVGASDANAEYVAEIRNLFNREGILWQAGEFGKIDEGGGGTVAKFLAAHGMDVLDCGAPLLTMHSPYEISSKLDVYEAYRAFKAFFKS